ncbi:MULTISPECIES: adenosine deaminase [Vibrio]|uniref:Adenosine deaminase n=1 Tax=Vibrio mediterranei TaxID=689 RepID=A0A3G4VEQ7_9VIBR|nr:MULTISPECIES: adenosine deaminase [Vibrio]AYV23313.1 adenosine deaminase [Vibrio mediterranei]USE03899.1 adenosine deaminase [Vibrio sp. SCSIO 43133]
MNYKQLPKIDLHCHLDGSVRPETIIELASIQGVDIPSQDIEVIRDLMIAPETCSNLLEYLKRFDLPLSVMQTKEALERIAFEVYEDAALENVKYMEVRFGPLLHREQGLNIEEIISSVVAGMKRAEEVHGIKGNIILSLLRHMPTDEINDVIDVGAAYLGKGVAAFDLAGGEELGFCEKFVPFAKYAKEQGLNVTIHAGEQGEGQNVYDAITMLGAERVGHGIHIATHQQAFDLVHEKQVALETCPSSNVQTKAVESMTVHPIEDFRQRGIPVTINTDNRTVSNTTMTKEVQLVIEQFGLSEEDYMHIYRNSVNAAFTNDAIKQQLLAV